VALLNELVARRSDTAGFCSAGFGWLRPARDGVEVILVSAGHPPPLLLRADGR
jgi:hypothetical protein